LSAALLFIMGSAVAAPTSDPQSKVIVPVLVYHRLGATAADSMTITTSSFAAQLQWLKDNHYTVIPLKQLMNYLQGTGEAPPSKSVVITADDGHISDYTQMRPLVQRYKIPVTLFIYPSAISHASYALTWEQVKTLQSEGFDVQGHTYWHPNFNREKKKQTPEAYAKFVQIQLLKSKTVLEKKLGTPITLLAWPFGIYNDELKAAAAQAGYVAAFSIDGRPVKKTSDRFALPRYMIVNSNSSIKTFAKLIEEATYVQSAASNSVSSPSPATES